MTPEKEKQRLQDKVVAAIKEKYPPEPTFTKADLEAARKEARKEAFTDGWWARHKWREGYTMGREEELIEKDYLKYLEGREG